MNWLFAIIIAVSIALAVAGYWRAQRLHLLIRRIEPHCPWVRTHLFTRAPCRKDRR